MSRSPDDSVLSTRSSDERRRHNLSDRASASSSHGPICHSSSREPIRPQPYPMSQPMPMTASEPETMQRGQNDGETRIKLYISNLRDHVSERDIQLHFSGNGGLVSCSVHYDRSGRPKGTAEIVFACRQDALRFIQECNNSPFEGNNVKVDLVLPAPPVNKGGPYDLLRRYRVPELNPAEYVEIAIENHRGQHGLKDPRCQLVEVLGCSRRLGLKVGLEHFGARDICHVSFIAKPLNSDDNILVFAQISDSGLIEFGLDFWWEGKPDHLGIFYGCGMCPHEKKYPHPRDTWLDAALSDFKPPSPSETYFLSASFQSVVLYKQAKALDFKQWRCHCQIFDETVPDESSFSPKLSGEDFARLALAHINQEEGAEFELVETMAFTRRLIRITSYAHWCHVCFTAKPKHADSSPVYFFTELHDPGVRSFSVKTYSRVDPDEYGYGTERGCGICPDDDKYPHPAVVSYTAGAWPPFGIGKKLPNLRFAKSKPLPSVAPKPETMKKGRNDGEAGIKLYISNLQDNVSECDIQLGFSEFGEIVSCSVHYDTSGRPKGMAEVVFARQQDALRFIQEHNNSPLDGQQIEVELVAPFPRPNKS